MTEEGVLIALIEKSSETMAVIAKSMTDQFNVILDKN